MRVVVIGCGSIGTRHARNLLALGHEVAAWNRGRSRREAIAAELGLPVYGDLDRMLVEFPADAAVVATPQTLHLEHALAAARAGLHLFIEKPLAHTLRGLEELEAEVAARGLITCVGSNMRFHFGPASVMRDLASGRLGRPLVAHLWGGMYLPDWHPDEDYRQMYSAKKAMGGGAVLDFIHELDLALWLFGTPARLAAMTRTSGRLDIETEDVADVILDYPDGPQVSVHLDYLQRPYQRGIRIVGDRGWSEWNLARECVERFGHADGEREVAFHPHGYLPNDMYLAQFEHFIRCVESGSLCASDLGAGRRALALALAIKESARQRRFMDFDPEGTICA